MKWIAVVLAGVIASIALFAIAYPSVTFRYRLTVEAEVDGQPKQGSGVIEVTYQRHMNIGAMGRDVGASFQGEAVVLDLGNRGALFALLMAGSDYRSGPESIVLKTFGLSGGAFPGWDDASLKKLRSLAGKRELPLDSLPMIVRFRDANDPKSVERIDPTDIAKNFGPDTRLTRATLEIVPTGIWPLNSLGITGEPITTGIEKWLPWISRHYDVKLDGQRYENSTAVLKLANSLASGAFRAGF
jgi:hypothetical protein